MPAQDYGFYLSAVESADAQPVITPGGSGYFSRPAKVLDPRLFQGQHLLPEVRNWILTTFYDYMDMHYKGARSWSTVWAAGSGISYQWAADRSNGDLDILIGVDFPHFYAVNKAYAGTPEEDMADIFNQGLHQDLWVLTDRTHIGVNSYPWVDTSHLTPAELQNATRLGLRSTPLPKSSAQADTRSSSASSNKGHNSERAGVPVDPSLESARYVGKPPSSGGASAALVSSYISASGTTNESTESGLKSSTGFWQSRMDGVLSAEQTARVGGGASMSTTAMRQEGSGDFSASAATTGSDSSGTTSKVSSGSSNTSNVGDGPFSVTFYVNPGGKDIRDINPYAAYDVSHDQWTVHPPILPDDPRSLYPAEFEKAVGNERAQAQALVARHSALLKETEALVPNSPNWVNATHALGLVASQARTLFDSIHLGRKNAFGEQGKGYGDYYNYRWQAHKEAGTVQALAALSQIDKDARGAQSTNLYGSPLLGASEALTRASLVRAGAGR